ncbi:hypothetical protein BaRGS_00010084 [Batillaria attramentaria]|uniref:Protein quiver n=1 Tax=Batillaria attramentaria TaxID=370345 RepID=A0ABD0LGR0_9CAEN
MNLGISRGLLTTVLLASFFTCCVAPQCFSCTQLDEGCGDRFGQKNTDAHFCDGTCAKFRGERYSNQVRIVEITRTCVAQRSEGCEDTRWNGISVKGCYCNTDFCNTADSLRMISAFAVFRVLLPVIVVWIYGLCT